MTDRHHINKIYDHFKSITCRFLSCADYNICCRYSSTAINTMNQ